MKAKDCADTEMQLKAKTNELTKFVLVFSRFLSTFHLLLAAFNGGNI